MHFFNLNQLRVLDISNSNNAIVNLPVHVFKGLICLKEVFVQNNQFDYISPKTFGQLLTDNVIYIDISGNYALMCKELCCLNPYHTEGYLQLVANHAKCDYSCNWSKC